MATRRQTARSQEPQLETVPQGAYCFAVDRLSAVEGRERAAVAGKRVPRALLGGDFPLPPRATRATASAVRAEGPRAPAGRGRRRGPADRVSGYAGPSAISCMVPTQAMNL